MAADRDPPISGAGRRPRRAVITDDSYEGADAFLERDAEANRPGPDAARSPASAAPPKRGDGDAPRSRGSRERAAAPKAARAPSGAAAWRWGVLATLVWLAGVGAFAAGFFQLPLTSAADMAAAAQGLPPHLQLMTAAIALAPLGLIWTSAMAAKRASALAVETRRLAARIDALDGADGAATAGAGRAQPGVLKDEADAATRAFGALEASFEAAEERAQLARDRLEAERTALAQLLQDIERNADGISSSLSRARRPSAPPSGADEGTMGLEPTSMLAPPARRSPRPADPPRRVERDDSAYERDVELDEEEDEDEFAFTPALAPERQSPAAGPLDRTENGGDAVQQIDALRRRVESGRPSSGRTVGAPPAAPPPAGGGLLDWSKFVAAANFPDSEDDQETLDALYAVLTDAEAAALLQSAEDALSALADIGLYMEDMQPHHAPTELWRAYVVDGKRRDMMDLGGVRDPHAVEDVTEALRAKPDFAAVTERFLDRYESVAHRLFAEAPTPTMAVELADTRSGRAYMLLARASGRFG